MSSATGASGFERILLVLTIGPLPQSRIRRVDFPLDAILIIMLVSRYMGMLGHASRLAMY